MPRYKLSDAQRRDVAAYLLEKLCKKGIISGTFFLDSRHKPHRTTLERLIYNSTNGYLFVFTPAAEFLIDGDEPSTTF